MSRVRISSRDIAPDEITSERAEELGACYEDYIYFTRKYCKIYDSVEKDWIPFKLWPAQIQVLKEIDENQLVVILKARQLGITWLALCYSLWTLLYRPISVVSLFSRRETESIYMLGSERLRGIFDNLPAWMRTGFTETVDAEREWKINTGSAARAFPTSAGDAYVSTLAIVDEADLAPNLNTLLGSVKPTIQMGGKLILLSRSNKSEPNSEFKSIYRGAKAKENSYHHIFLPWHAHPERDQAWYQEQVRDSLSRTGSLDDLHEQYPETDSQALSSRTLDKRIPPMWIEACYLEGRPIRAKGSPSLSALDIYKAPVPGRRYVAGADPAEGNPNSDESSMTILDLDTHEEVATFSVRAEPAVFASYIAQISNFFNYCPVLVERNNHGHAVIQWLEEHSRRTKLLLGHDSDPSAKKKIKGKRQKTKPKYGWLTSTLGKTILYTECTDFFRENAKYDKPGEESNKVLHSLPTYLQLQSIETSTLKAPEGDHDDRATSFALAVCAIKQAELKGNSAGLTMAGTKGWGM